MNHRALGAVVLSILMLPMALDPASGSHAAPPSPGVAEWWGPTAPSAGHHIRVPVTIQNDRSYQVSEVAVRATIDVADVLAKAGWIHTEGGGKPLLKGFQLDPDSIRVVRVSDFGPSGRMLVHDSTRTGLDRYEVPSQLVQGSITEVSQAYDPSTSPVITLFWWASVPLGPAGSPAGTQRYHVYLDTLTNIDHPPSSLQGADVGAAASIHWAGPSDTYYGAIPATRTDQGSATATIIGLYDNTRVFASIRQGSSYLPHQFQSEYVLDQGETAIVGLGGDAVEFRLSSIDPSGSATTAAPFLAFVDLHGFVPALTGGHAGSSFVVEVPATENAPRSVNFISPYDQPTTVTLTPEFGNSRTFVIGGEQRLPYTVGAWVNGATPACRPSSGNAALEPGMMYTISSTPNDIMVQLGGSMPVQQIPDLSGGPEGTDFAFTMVERWSRPEGGCRAFQEARSWWALSDSATAVRASSPEDTPAQFDPPPTASDPTPGKAVPVAPAYAGPFTQSNNKLDRPIYVNADDPTTVLAGFLRTSRAQVSGALGGQDALTFSGIGPASVIGLYPDTKVDLQVHRLTSGTTIQSEFVSEGQVHQIRDNANNDAVAGWTIQSSKPISVYGLADRPSFLSGTPAKVSVSVGVADFRGALLDIASTTGLEPQTASTTPGKSVTYSFAVTNLGRAADGSGLDDVANLRVGPLLEGWTAVLDQSVIPLSSGASSLVRLTVTPPEDAPARTSAVIPVIATSENNPSLSVSTGTVTYLKQSFNVGAWFDVVGGPKTKERSSGAGDSQTYKVVIKNTGTVSDTIDLEPSGIEPGWSVELRKPSDGKEVGQVVLDPASSVTLDLVVSPPPDLPDGLLVAILTATSASQPAAFDRITSITRVQAPADLRVEYDDTTRLVAPGAEAAFPIHVVNEGLGPIELNLEARADMPSGWAAPKFLLVNSVTGERIPVSKLSIGPGDELDFIVNTTVALDSLEGALGTVRALARAVNGGSSFEVAFTATTAARHQLTVLYDPILQGRSDGKPIAINMTIINKGNLDERISPGTLDAPADWRVANIAPVVIPRGATKAFTALLSGPIGAPASIFNLTLGLVSEDGSVTPAKLRVDVPKSTAIEVEGGIIRDAQPARPAVLDVNVTNTGNRRGHLEVRAADSWALRQSPAVFLEPGQTGVLHTGWLVPPTTKNGESTHSLEIVFVPEDSSPSVVHTIVRDVDVDRPQLRLKEAAPRAAPGGTLVVAIVENIGQRGAHDVQIQLQTASGEVVDEVVIGFLAPGNVATLSLLDSGKNKGLNIVLDPLDQVIESNEGDNIVAVSSLNAAAPGLHLLALIAVLATVTWVRKRSPR